MSAPFQSASRHLLYIDSTGITWVSREWMYLLQSLTTAFIQRLFLIQRTKGLDFSAVENPHINTVVVCIGQVNQLVSDVASHDKSQRKIIITITLNIYMADLLLSVQFRAETYRLFYRIHANPLPTRCAFNNGSSKNASSAANNRNGD